MVGDGNGEEAECAEEEQGAEAAANRQSAPVSLQGGDGKGGRGKELTVTGRGGWYCGGLCRCSDDARVYEEAGIASDRIFLVSADGKVELYSPETREGTSRADGSVPQYPHQETSEGGAAGSDAAVARQGDGIGASSASSAGASAAPRAWGSFVELYPHLHHLFPRVERVARLGAQCARARGPMRSEGQIRREVGEDPT